jgi:hypothetical protein
MGAMVLEFGCRSVFAGEQRSEPYVWYGEMSSTDKNAESTPKAISGKRLCRLAGKGGA